MRARKRSPAPRRAVVSAAALALLAAPLDAQAPPDTVTLLESARLALENHPSVRAAVAAVRGAEADRSEARAAWLPAVSSRVALTRFEEPMVVAPIHGLDPTSAPAFDRTTVQGGLALGYTLFDGGARPARVAAASRLTDAARAGQSQAEMELLHSVVRAYLSVLTAQDIVDAQRRRVQALIREQERADRFFTEGASPRIEVLRADAALSRARAETRTSELGLGLAVRELARLTSQSEESLASAVFPEIRAASPQTTSPEMAVPPRVEAASMKLDAARESRRVARAAWLPRLEADGGFTRFGAPDVDFTGEWQLGVRLSYALFTGGARSAAGDRAEARLRQADHELALARLQTRSQEDRAETELQGALARAQALGTAVQQFEEVVRIESLALDAGAGVQTDLLAAEASLLEVRAQLAQARHAALGARAALALARGTLDLTWIEDHLDHPLENQP